MKGVIVCPQVEAVEVGRKIFEEGGNAIDAAIAVNIVQGVVAPETCGIGGDLFALIWKDGEETVIKQGLHNTSKPETTACTQSY